MAKPRHLERHRTGSIGWLRAAVLGANDGIVSTASLVLGVAASNATSHSILIAGGAGLVSGAMSMAAGEYVSVHSQADTEKAQRELERAELKADPVAEHRELAAIDVARGLTPALATAVAEQLMATDAEAAHLRDELGLTETNAARPLQAALSSAASFSVGAAVPVVLCAVVPTGALIPSVAGTALLLLASLGFWSAKVGGARPWLASLRVTFWGALAMALTAGVGRRHGVAAGHSKRRTVEQASSRRGPFVARRQARSSTNPPGPLTSSAPSLRGAPARRSSPTGGRPAPRRGPAARASSGGSSRSTARSSLPPRATSPGR